MPGIPSELTLVEGDPYRREVVEERPNHEETLEEDQELGVALEEGRIQTETEGDGLIPGRAREDLYMSKWWLPFRCRPCFAKCLATMR